MEYMEYEFGPALVALACFGVALVGIMWFRRRRFHRMTANERAWALDQERRARDHFAGRD